MQNDELPELLIRNLLKKHRLFSVDYKTMDALSLILKSTYQVNISSNTLARLCRLRKDTASCYDHTLDALAKAAGYFTYKRFADYINARSIMKWTDKPEGELSFISQYTLKAARENDIRYLESLEKYMEDNGCELNTFCAIGGAMLNGLRANKKPRKLLNFMSQSPMMIDAFFESYVDVDYFSAYFGEGMVKLSKNMNQLNRTYLFSNCVALMHEKERGLLSAYKKRAKKLADIDTNYLDTLFADNVIYPPSRWLAAMIDFNLQQKQLAKATLLFDYAMHNAKRMGGDEAIIMISLLTDIGDSLPLKFINKLEELYGKKSTTVLYAFDCLVNAALNLSLLMPSKKKFSLSEINHLVNSYPSIFITYSATIEAKVQRVYNNH